MVVNIEDLKNMTLIWNYEKLTPKIQIIYPFNIQQLKINNISSLFR